jgi:hypothetical protein
MARVEKPLRAAFLSLTTVLPSPLATAHRGPITGIHAKPFTLFDKFPQVSAP